MSVGRSREDGLRQQFTVDITRLCWNLQNKNCQTGNTCFVLGLPVLFSCSVVPGSLRPHGLQHARLPCPSLSPRVFSDSCPLSRWCRPTISSSDACSSYPHMTSYQVVIVRSVQLFIVSKCLLILKLLSTTGWDGNWRKMPVWSLCTARLKIFHVLGWFFFWSFSRETMESGYINSRCKQK